MNQEELDKIMQDNPELKALNCHGGCAQNEQGDTIGTKPVSKYHNAVTDYLGRIFQSGHEAEVARDIQLEIKAGEMLAVCYQVRIPLTESRKRKEVVFYVADFITIDKNLKVHVIDAKSEPTKTYPYRMKKKLMKEKYNVDIEER
jgi:hypothetical protein